MTAKVTETPDGITGENNSQSLAKIETTKVLASEDNQAKPVDASNEKIKVAEKNLLGAVRLLLRTYGVRKSAAAIRDAVEVPHSEYTPIEAVSSLNAFGFQASFGAMPASKIKSSFLPALAFMNDSEVVVVSDNDEEGYWTIRSDSKSSQYKSVSHEEFRNNYSGYLILTKQLNKRQREEQRGHWFFSAFRKSKWLYVQVMLQQLKQQTF